MIHSLFSQLMVGIAFCLGIYILLEAIDDAARYAGLNRICMVVRDVSTFLAGVGLASFAWTHQIDGLHVALALPLSLYIWPKMLLRARRMLNRWKKYGSPFAR
jgi:hypothetical protein